jgi:proliferating cell nuclear antigen
VTDANFECNEEGIVLQAMDNSHVALVSVKFSAPAFKRYRCDRPMPLGVNLTSLTKVLKCAKDDDICTLKAADEADVLNLVYEAKSTSPLTRRTITRFSHHLSDSDRIAEYDMKLMDIDADTLNIPETEYDARVTLPSAEFTRIVRDLSQLGESVRIEVSKEGVRFASDGEAANGNVLLRQSDGSHITGSTIKPKSSDGDEEEDEAEGSSRKKAKVKKEKTDGDVDMEDEDKEKEDEDKEKDDEDEEDFKPKDDEDGEEEKDDDDDEEDSGSKKRKKKVRAQDPLHFLFIVAHSFSSNRPTETRNPARNPRLPRRVRRLKRRTRLPSSSR